MKKLFIMIFIAFMLLGMTGCDEDTSDPYEFYKYTGWKTTDGYVLQIREDDCLIGKDGKAFNRVCKFDANASDTGVAKLTICDNLGTNCDSLDLTYNKRKLTVGQSSIYVYGRTWYYDGTVSRTAK